jgi:DNA-binding MarR family transcriptional regulator
MGTILANLERAAHLIGAYLDPTASKLGITQGEAHVLAQLATHGPTVIGELHREFGHKRSTLTNVVDRLEGRGLVRREINVDDRRSFVVHLTVAGRRAAASITRTLDELEHALDAHTDKRALARTIDALERLVSGEARRPRASPDRLRRRSRARQRPR